jgi:hypothetical protein
MRIPSKATFLKKNPFICQNGKITNSITQGQNIEYVITMLKSNAEKIHKRKVVQSKRLIRRKIVDQFFQCSCVLDTAHPVPFHEQTPWQPLVPTI